jgi:hypothetical protein
MQFFIVLLLVSLASKLLYLFLTLFCFIYCYLCIYRDFYALNLCQLNKILLSCKYPGDVLKSTYALDIVHFTSFALDLEYREKLAAEQLAFVNYVQCCKKRLTSKFRLTDFQYKQVLLMLFLE